MKIMLIYVLILFAASSAMTEIATASEFGCKSILCLASPGGPMQYEECRPTIKKLYRHLYLRRPFPSCDMEESEGIDIVQGVEPWETCEEGYEPAMKAEDYGDERMRQVRVCRKQKDRRGIATETVPVYDEYIQRKRSEPHFVELRIDGQQQGERFYYRKERR